MEQTWQASAAWFALGHLGFVIRILWSFINSGQKRLSHLDNYLAENGAVFLLGLLSYWAVASLWLWTEAIGFLGGVGEFVGVMPGQLNAWTIIIAIIADLLLKFIVNKWGDKIGADAIADKIAQAVPKVTKPTDPPQP